MIGLQTQAQVQRTNRLDGLVDSLAPGILAVGAATGRVLETTGNVVAGAATWWGRHPVAGTAIVGAVGFGTWYLVRRTRSRYPVLAGVGAGTLAGLAMLSRNAASTAESALRTKNLLGAFRAPRSNPYAASAPQPSAYQAPGVYQDPD